MRLHDSPFNHARVDGPGRADHRFRVHAGHRTWIVRRIASNVTPQSEQTVGNGPSRRLALYAASFSRNADGEITEAVTSPGER